MGGVPAVSKARTVKHATLQELRAGTVGYSEPPPLQECGLVCGVWTARHGESHAVRQSHDTSHDSRGEAAARVVFVPHLAIDMLQALFLGLKSTCMLKWKNCTFTTPHIRLRCVNRWYICVTVCAKRSDGPERRPLEGARMRNQRPCRCPLRPERAAGAALWPCG